MSQAIHSTTLSSVAPRMIPIGLFSRARHGDNPITMCMPATPCVLNPMLAVHISGSNNLADSQCFNQIFFDTFRFFVAFMILSSHTPSAAKSYGTKRDSPNQFSSVSSDVRPASYPKPIRPDLERPSDSRARPNFTRSRTLGKCGLMYARVKHPSRILFLLHQPVKLLVRRVSIASASALVTNVSLPSVMKKAPLVTSARLRSLVDGDISHALGRSEFSGIQEDSLTNRGSLLSCMRFLLWSPSFAEVLEVSKLYSFGSACGTK